MVQRLRSQRRDPEPAPIKANVLLDSGAYSAWMRQEDNIGLQKYISYVREHRAIVDLYVNLDVLPGAYGRKVTDEDIQQSAQRSYDNLQEMKAAGLHPLPVFHQGEDFSWLEKMLYDGERCIGFSPRQDLSSDQQMAWLDRVFSIITDGAGNPLIHSHGFGVTKVHFLLRYPFTTADSTRWTLDPGYGHALIPQWRNGAFDYLQPPHIIATTGVDSKVNAKKQVRGFSEVLTAHIEDYAVSLGLSIDQLRTDRLARIRTYLHYYEQFAKALEPFPFTDIVYDWFQPGVKLPPGLSPITRRKLKVYFATFCRGVDVQVVDAMGIKTRLLSYYELRNQEPSALYDYVKNGYLPTRRNINRRSRSADETDRPPWQA